MTALTTLQIAQLNKMNEAARKAQLGTRLNALELGELAQAQVIKYSTTPASVSATATKTAIALTVSAQAGITAGITQPDVCRVLTIKGNATMAGNVVIHGTDYLNGVVTDTIALNNATEAIGLVAFKTVTSIDYPAWTNSGSDTISIGRSKLIGLPVAVPNAAMVVLNSFNGADDTGTVTANAAVSLSVFSVNGVPDGSKILLIYILQ